MVDENGDKSTRLPHSNPGDGSNHRVMRSALPILNDLPSKSHVTKLNDDHRNDKGHSRVIFSDNDPPVGRYHNFIQPTTTSVKSSKLVQELSDDLTYRMAKDLNEGNSFLLKGDPRLNMSGSPPPISMIIATQTSPNATTKNNNPRQNKNPDIQDIITGIVKLLNGNVNVHANTSPSRRPISTRINNRGPPRISESQPINDYEQSQSSTFRPPQPYLFDRPEGPARPFLTGVPIPEQIVPSMQQNYRPGFISQNRPPWQRPRPRPPITENTRRPIPAFNIPPLGPITTTQTSNGLNEDLSGSDGIGNLDQNTYEVQEETHDSNASESATEINEPMKKEEFNKKKDKQKEKKPVLPIPNQEIDPNKGEASEMDTLLHEINSMPTLPNLVLSTTTNILHKETELGGGGLNLGTDIHDLESSIQDFTKGSSTTVAVDSSTPVLDTIPKTTDRQVASTNGIESFDKNFKPTITKSPGTAQSGPAQPFHPRPGLVLDDPEFKPGGHKRPNNNPPNPIQTNPIRPPGYGEIFDVTLSAIQGPTGGGSGVQTVQIKPFGASGGTGAGGQYQNNGDIILSAAGDDGFVSIDGKRTYINLFGEPTEAPKIAPTTTLPASLQSTQQPNKPHYGIVETETVKPPLQQQVQAASQRPLYRPRPPQSAQQAPPPRIDTCIVGDDSTCDLTQNEKCKTDAGVSSCHCRPGYARRNDRDPCRKVVSIILSLRVDKIYERRVVWDSLLSQPGSDAYGQLSFESMRAIDSAMSMTPFSDEFMEARVNKIYNGDASRGEAGVFVNLTLALAENGDTLRPALKGDIQRHLLGVIHRRNNNIGNSALFVESPPGSVTNLQDLDECTSVELNDCHPEAICTNIWGSFRCECPSGLRDPWSDQPQRSGRDCQSCPDSHCNGRGSCSYENGNQVCTCSGNYYGAQCEIDGEVLGVAIGASVAAVIIIVLTLVCLVMWSRRWQREQKHMGSPVFGYMTGQQVKTPVMGQTPYQVSLEDRMRWAQIADVMAAQANHYAVEPGTQTRPGSAMFGYPNLQTMSNMGTMSMNGTMPMHGTLPPVPLPR